MWIKVKSGAQTIFYNPKEVEEWGKFDPVTAGLSVKIKGEKDTVFLPLDVLDELYALADLRLDFHLLQTGYTPKVIREHDAETLRKYIED
jgi:hypothetical protein